MMPLRHGSFKLSSAVLSRKEINYNTIVGASRNRNADPSHSLSPECAPVMTMSRCGPSKLSSAVLSPSEMKHNHNMKQLLDTNLQTRHLGSSLIVLRLLFKNLASLQPTG
jgi:hypothetical protein